MKQGLIQKRRVSTTNVQETSFVDKEESEDSRIRETLSLTSTVTLLLLPIILYIIVCTFNELTNLNLEGITGGFLRTFTGVLAYTSIELLITGIIIRLYFRVLSIRLDTKESPTSLKYDFLREYLSLESWQRIKVDIVIFFLLLFLIVINTIVLLNRIPLT